MPQPQRGDRGWTSWAVHCRRAESCPAAAPRVPIRSGRCATSQRDLDDQLTVDGFGAHAPRQARRVAEAQSTADPFRRPTPAVDFQLPAHRAVGSRRRSRPMRCARRSCMTCGEQSSSRSTAGLEDDRGTFALEDDGDAESGMLPQQQAVRWQRSSQVHGERQRRAVTGMAIRIRPARCAGDSANVGICADVDRSTSHGR
jgi:hypothetical protein